MKKNFKALLVMLAFIMSLTLVSCGGNNAANQKENESSVKTETVESGGSFVVNDKAGRDVTFEKIPETVIALNPSDAEILDSINQTGKIVAIGQYVDNPETILNLPKLDTGMNLNIEEIINLAPDVVFMTDMATSEEQVKQLEDAGINIVITSAKSIEDTYNSIELVSEVMGVPEDGKKVVEQMKAEFTEIAKDASSNEGKTVYFEISPLEYGLWTAGSGTFSDDIAELLGAKNIFKDDVMEFGEISEEEVISRNPDYIVTTSMGNSDEVINEILNRPGWENITAVKNKAVMHSADSSMTRPSPRLVKGAKDMQELLKK